MVDGAGCGEQIPLNFWKMFFLQRGLRVRMGVQFNGSPTILETGPEGTKQGTLLTSLYLLSADHVFLLKLSPTSVLFLLSHTFSVFLAGSSFFTHFLNVGVPQSSLFFFSALTHSVISIYPSHQFNFHIFVEDSQMYLQLSHLLELQTCG